MDLETEIIDLGKTCAGIRSELSGVQALMQKLTNNQDTLIALTQRHENTEKKLDKIDDALAENFTQLRCLQAQRLGPRVSELENGRRWRRTTFFLSLSSLTVGGLILWFRKMIMG